MPFEAGALEVLGDVAAAISLGDFLEGFSEGIAEAGEAAALCPVAGERLGDIVASLGKVAHRVIGRGRSASDWRRGDADGVRVLVVDVVLDELLDDTEGEGAFAPRM